MVGSLLHAGAKLRMEPLALATAARLYHQFFRDFHQADFDRHASGSALLSSLVTNIKLDIARVMSHSNVYSKLTLV